MKISRRQFEIAAVAAAIGPRIAVADERAAAKDVPWLADVQTPPSRLPDDAPRLASLLIDSQGKRIATRADWQQHRQTLRGAWLELLGAWASPRQSPHFEILASEQTGGVVRRLIAYESEPGVSVEAYLLAPLRPLGRLPGAVVFHSTTDQTIREVAGLEGKPETAWGLKLAQRGFLTICPRCFLWDGSLPPDYARRVAEHQARHPAARGMAKMLFDGQRALDLLAALPEVDPERLGAAGHSLGAKEALYLAALDDRVKAVVASEGGIGTTFSNWDAPWYLDTKQLGREHHELLGLIAPRPFLLIGGNSADGARSWPFIAAALEVYRLFGPRCRVGLFNHGQGHTVPALAEQRAIEWLQAYE
jgi:dienelactone hydrolase